MKIMVSVFYSYLYLFGIIINASLDLILVNTMFKRYKESRIKILLFLFIFYIADIILLAAEMVPFLEHFDNIADFYISGVDNVYFYIFTILGIATAGIFLLFTDYFEDESISMRNAIVFVVFLTSYVEYVAYNLANSTPVGLEIPNTPLSMGFIPVIFLLYVVVVSIKGLLKIRKEVLDPVQKSQINRMILTIIFYYFVTSNLIGFSHQSPFPLSDETTLLLRTILPKYSIIIGHFIMYRTYAKAKVAFLSYQKMEKLLVISKEGLPLYSYDFISSADSETVNILLSGGMTAIIGMLNETLGTSGIKMIEFLDKQIMIVHQANFAIFLVVDRPSSFLWNAITIFAGILERKMIFGDQTDSLIRSQPIQADSDLKIAFGL
ncbi:MAG: hypothetical protein OEY49_08305 [Candidatus Heimdallarchaeota archaeon]|nr:hypothetical protein [Candidatus Heimdallarchaeota archaeon]